MKRRHPLLYLSMLVVLFASGGANCRLWRASLPPAPLAPELGPPQSLEEAIDSINVNSTRINQLQASGVDVDIPGLPKLKADLAMQRPKRFHMKVMSFVGPEMDLGSNDEVFWMWIKRNQPPSVYFARHDQYARSNARQIFPVPPHWLIEALGVVYLDPADRHEGPFSRGDGRMEIRSHTVQGGQELTKVTVIDEKYRWILEQHVYDGRGQLLASARASKHEFYPQQGVSLPRHVSIHLPPAQLSLEIELNGRYTINQLTSDPSQLFSPTQLQAYPRVDVADPRFQMPGQTTPASAQPSHYSPRPPLRTGHRPRYRGDGTRR